MIQQHPPALLRGNHLVLSELLGSHVLSNPDPPTMDTVSIQQPTHRQVHPQRAAIASPIGPASAVAAVGRDLVDEDLEPGFDAELAGPLRHLLRLVQERRALLSHHLRGRVAEHPLRALTEHGDRAGEVSGDDRVLGGRSENRVQRAGQLLLEVRRGPQSLDTTLQHWAHEQDHERRENPAAPVARRIRGRSDHHCRHDEGQRRAGSADPQLVASAVQDHPEHGQDHQRRQARSTSPADVARQGQHTEETDDRHHQQPVELRESRHPGECQHGRHQAPHEQGKSVGPVAERRQEQRGDAQDRDGTKRHHTMKAITAEQSHGVPSIKVGACMDRSISTLRPQNPNRGERAISVRPH